MTEPDAMAELDRPSVLATNAPRLPDTWATEDAPVLVAAIACLDRDGCIPSSSRVVTEAQLPPEIVVRSLLRLTTGGYLVGKWTSKPQEGVTFPPANVRIDEATEKARRAVGQWPDPDVLAADVLAALTELADNGPENKQKPAQRILEALREDGRTVLTGVIATVATKTLGL